MSDVLFRLESREGATLAEAVVASPYLLPLGDVEIVESSATLVRLHLARRAGAFRIDDGGAKWADVPVGGLPILSSLGGRNEFHVTELTLPAPSPFTSGDIDSMWAAACGLPAPVPNSVRRDALSHASISAGGPAPSLPLLPLIAAVATKVVRRWPTREATSSYWRAIDLPGGREDVKGTVSKLWRAGVTIGHGDRALPAQSLRYRSDSEPWHLSALEATLTEVIRLVRQQLADGIVEEAGGAVRGLLMPVEAATVLGSASRRSGVDPSPSSWPKSLRSLYEVALAFIAGASATGIGTRRAPLCHLWALYESWVAALVLQSMQDALGAPPSEPASVVGMNTKGGITWRAGWEHPKHAELWIQAEITNAVENLNLPITTVTAPLIPDCIIVVRDSDQFAMHVVDAKLRRDRMTEGEVGEQASKYLWGIRRSDKPDTHALAHVILVSPSDVAHMRDPEKARIAGVTASPGHESELNTAIQLLFE